MRLWLFIAILWTGIIYMFLVGPERASAVIHPLHVWTSILAVAAVSLAFLVVVGLLRLLKVVFLVLVAVVLAVLVPVCSLVVFAHPFGPVVGVCFLIAILIRAIFRHAD